MAVNQAKILDSLEQITKTNDKSEFIYAFLSAFNFPKNTITLLKTTSTRNVAKIAGHTALKNRLYFQPVADGNISDALELLINDSVISTNKIRFIMLTDFENFMAYDTKFNERLDIPFADLHLHYGFFLPLVGLEKATLPPEIAADVKAAEKMGKLFELIRDRNEFTSVEDNHALNVFLTRLLFCFFAEDTGIFAQGQLTAAIKHYTEESGEDVGLFFTELFVILNSEATAPARQNRPTHLTAFPYVNGGLFAANEPAPLFSAKGRRLLIECGSMDWSSINPDIFGSMFQAVIDEEQRSRLGQHYTSVSNIMKVIKPLFLDKLYAELDKHRRNEKQLRNLQLRLSKVKVFDPACGSGNFLIIAYKELRQLEMAILKAIEAVGPQNKMFMSVIRLDQFYGIEIDDFAHEIAKLSLWLTEHQLNKHWESQFGEQIATLPLRSSGNITCGNSLQLDWQVVCPKSTDDEVYVIGNPPFLGTRDRTEQQMSDISNVFDGVQSFGGLDFVACWFWLGAQYIQNSKAELALVATNSICQGEQASILWPAIFDLGLHIHFAYQTFAWANNAKDKAAVHVIVVGITSTAKQKVIFQEIDNRWHKRSVINISPYLIEGGQTAITSRAKPFYHATSIMTKGSQPTDGGNLLLDKMARDELLKQEPLASQWIKPILGSAEFLNGKERWCLWLVGITAAEIAAIPVIQDRVAAVRNLRLASKKTATKKKAATPHLFDENRQPTSGEYILVPRVSSERRPYVPLGFFSCDVISSDANLFIPNGTLYDFGIMSSILQNDWMRLVAGRLKSDYRYSATIVYNTFPWPDVNEAQRQQITALAEEILLVREDYIGKTLAELYDPDKMPEPLKAAHQALDNAVDCLYQPKPFADAAARLTCLLARYESLVAQDKQNNPKKPASKRATKATPSA